jgi:predicted transposase/invertase (TIGR01784 family)
MIELININSHFLRIGFAMLKKGAIMKQDNFIMLPTVDFCFKELMQNPKVRRGFIAALLKMDPESIQDTMLLPNELGNHHEDDKLGVLDVRVQLFDGTQLDLEMQVRFFEYWNERALFYNSSMFVSQIKKGDSYSILKKCIHIGILDFVHYPEDEECYRTFHFRDDKTGALFSDKMELQILELKKLPKKMQTEEDIMVWMKFFSGKSKEDFEIMAKTNEYLDEAYHELVEISADDRKRLQYEAREKALKDYNTQMYSAEKKGRLEGEKLG